MPQGMIEVKGVPSADLHAELTRAKAAFLGSIDVRPTTRENYAKALTYFLEWLTKAGVADLRQAALAWREHLISAGRTANTAGNYIRAVKQFYKWLFTQGHMPVDLGAGIKTPKPKTHTRDALTATQARRLVDGIRSEYGRRVAAIRRCEQADGRKRTADKRTAALVALRDFALINLMARTGIRVIETVRADIGDLRTRAGENVLYLHGKGRDAKDAFVLLTAEAYNPILDYLSKRATSPKDAPLFVSFSDRNPGGRLSRSAVRHIVKDYYRAVGLDSPRLSAHSLRHTAIDLAIQGGASPVATQGMARHADLNTTMLYYHTRDRTGEGAAERAVSF